MKADPGGPKTRKARVPKVQPRIVKPPAGDIASSGGDYGMREAKRAERSAPVKRAQRQVYDAQPVAQKKRIIKNATGSVRANLAPVHDAMVRRNHELAVSAAAKDTKGDTERGRAAHFLLAHPEILHPEHPHHGSLMATITGAASLGRSLAPKVAAITPVGTLNFFTHGGVVKVAGNAAKDLVDIPAAAPAALYREAKLGVDAGIARATGQSAESTRLTRQLVKDQTDPYVQLAKHPGKSLVDHPISSALLISGAEGAVGRTAGRVARALPSKTLRAAAGTARDAATVPGTNLVNERRYSPDIIRKGAQVAGEKIAHKVKVRKAAKRGQPAPARSAPTMSDHAIRRRVDENVAAGKIQAQRHAGQVQHEAEQAVGRKPTAATVLAARGITDTSKADLQAYLAEIRGQAQHLVGDDLSRNLRAQAQIADAIKHHDPARVAQATQAYQALADRLEQGTLSRGLIDPAKAESTRLVGGAVRKLGTQTGATAARTAKAQTKDIRVRTGRATKQAKRDAQAADIEYRKALAGARVSAATNSSSAALRAAEKEQRAAAAEVAKAKRANDVARGRAQVLSRNIGGKAGGHGVSTTADALRAARVAAREADRRVRAERAKIRGVAPDAADNLLKAIGNRDAATATVATARVASKAARREHIDTKTALKQGGLVGPDGRVIPLPKVRQSAHGNPAYVSDERGGRMPSAVPSERPSIKADVQNTGATVKHGTLETDPQVLVASAVRRQRTIDAHDNFSTLAHDIGHRDPVTGDIKKFGTEKNADISARDIGNASGVKMATMPHPDGGFMVVPAAAKSQLLKHENVPGQHPLMKQVGRNWRTNVLAFSPRWLVGNPTEATVRAGVMHAGPLSYMTARKVLKKAAPEDRQAILDRAVGGGNYRTADRSAHEHVAVEDLSRMAAAAHRFGQRKAPAAALDLYHGYTRFVFHTLNGRIENSFQTAMLGKALRDSPLMSDHFRKLSDKATTEAAAGLKNTATQVALAREVQRAYGKYDAFSPGTRQAIAQYTPFVAWTRNALQFLYVVLPKDHPVLTATIVASDRSTTEWRKTHDMPALARTLAHATPFSLLDNPGHNPLNDLGSLLLPQFSEIVKNFGGKDWKDDSLTHPHGTPTFGRDVVAAVSTFVEGQVPAASQVARISGVRLPNMADTDKIKPHIGDRASAVLNPLAARGADRQRAPKKARPPKVVKRQSLGGSGGKIPLGGSGHKLPLS